MYFLVTLLKSHWHETNTAVLARKSELESCHRDSITFQNEKAALEKLFSGPGPILKLKKTLDKFVSSAEALVQKYPNDGDEYVRGVIVETGKYYEDLVAREMRLLTEMEARGSEVRAFAILLLCKAYVLIIRQ